MTETAEVATTSTTELLATGRRNLAVRDFNMAASTLAKACEALAAEHGDTSDQCAEAYLWYGKALLGLSREESGVLGDGVPGTGNAEEEDSEENEENGENGVGEHKDEKKKPEKNGEAEKSDAPSSSNNGEASSSNANGGGTAEEPLDQTAAALGSSTTLREACEDPKRILRFWSELGWLEWQPTLTYNGSTGGPKCGKWEPKKTELHTESGENDGDAEGDESAVNLENEDDVDNLQLAWEMLDLSRSILYKRVQDGGGSAARSLLADVHLALGEVALESETYDKAVIDMQSCLDLQKELYGSDDRRIAETHYQIGLANSLASNFEEAITHFKNAANILESRIKTLESPTARLEDATVKKFSTTDPSYSVDGEIKELKELLPEIHEKIQDMMDYKTETIKRVRESLCPSNGPAGEASSSSDAGASTSSSAPKPAASDISHLIKRKRKSSESDDNSSASKKANT